MVPEESARHTEPARLRSDGVGATADDIVEQLAGRGDADDLEVDIADAESFAGGREHVAVGDGDVASGSARPGERSGLVSIWCHSC